MRTVLKMLTVLALGCAAAGPAAAQADLPAATLTGGGVDPATHERCHTPRICPMANDVDVPMEVSRYGHEGVTWVVVQVDPSGAITGCTVTKSSGFQSMDEYSCRIATQRSEWAPATGPDGKPVASGGLLKFAWLAAQD